jgi:quinol monooxygenase YgiN
MMTLIAALRLKPGLGEGFATAFPDNAKRVLAAESGTLRYKLTRLRAEPDTFRVVEFYESQEAVDLHMENLKKPPSGIGELLAEPPVIEVHDDV